MRKCVELVIVKACLIFKNGLERILYLEKDRVWRMKMVMSFEA